MNKIRSWPFYTVRQCKNVLRMAGEKDKKVKPVAAGFRFDTSSVWGWSMLYIDEKQNEIQNKWVNNFTKCLEITWSYTVKT